MERIVTQEDITRTVHRLGLEGEAVVSGHGVLVALGIEGHGMFGRLELTVDDGTYRGLRETSGWQNTVEDLRQDGVVVRSGRSETVTRHGFELNGVEYEGLPDIYGQAQATGDRGTEDQIRSYLLSPQAQLPMAVIGGELEKLNGKVPERLHESVELVVAAQGLYAVRTLYGSLADANSVQTYQGDYETEPVLSIYHNYEHTWFDVVSGVAEHALRVDMADNELLVSLAAAATHDVVMGNGRQADSPDSYDELRAAELCREWLLRTGAHERWAQAGYEGVLATAFNESTGSQNVRPEAGFLAVQTAVAGADLSRSSMLYNVQNGFLWPLEDLQRRRHGGLLQSVRTEAQRSWGLALPELMLGVIDEDPRLCQEFGRAVAGNGGFFENLTYPTGWSLDNPEQRQKAAAILRDSGSRIIEGASPLIEYEQMQRIAPAPWDKRYI